MALNLKMIESLLIKSTSESTLASILLEYAIVKQKLEDMDSQSWYFRQGKESFRLRLASLTHDFESIRELFNEAPIDFFIHNIHKNNLYISGFDKKAINSIVYMSFGLLRSKNKFYTELIQLKSKTKTLMPIDFYLKNPEEFMKIID